MPPSRMYTYYVIQFLELPYPNIERYVCIPNHWVRTRNPKNLTVLVSYPPKPSPLTEERVRSGSYILKRWKLYKVKVLHGTHDIESAASYIDFRLHPQGKTPIERIDDGDLLASLQIPKVFAPVTHRKRRLSTTSIEPKVSKMQKSVSPAHSLPESEPHKKLKKHEQNTKTDPAMIDQLNIQIGDMQEHIRKYKSAVSDLDSTMNYVTECLNKIQNHVNSSSTTGENTASPKQIKTRKVEKIKRRSSVISSSPEDFSDEDSIDNSSSTEESDRKRFNSNSKLTLKYPRKKRNLCDLGSGVWVNENELNKCKRRAKDQESFTQKMLKLVFTKKALNEALPAEVVEKATHDSNYENLVPNLDDHALGVVASYVQEHAKAQGWL